MIAVSADAVLGWGSKGSDAMFAVADDTAWDSELVMFADTAVLGWGNELGSDAMFAVSADSAVLASEVILVDPAVFVDPAVLDWKHRLGGSKVGSMVISTESADSGVLCQEQLGSVGTADSVDPAVSGKEQEGEDPSLFSCDAGFPSCWVVPGDWRGGDFWAVPGDWQGGDCWAAPGDWQGGDSDTPATDQPGSWPASQSPPSELLCKDCGRIGDSDMPACGHQPGS